MDFFNEAQIRGLVVFLVGMGILGWCARMERREYKEIRDDPKAKWEVIDGVEARVRQAKRRSARGFFMTLVGLGAALYGIVVFFMNI